MALFPTPRTPVPAQRHIVIYTLGLLIFSIILILCIYGWTRNENYAGPVSKEYYIKAQEDESWIEKFIGDPVALFTLVLTGFTGGLYIATRSLYDATERLVRGAEDTSKRQLRAYVGIKTSNVDLCIERQGTSGRLIVRIENVGLTPATKITSSIGMFIGDERSIEGQEEPIFGIGYLFPKGTHSVRSKYHNIELPTEQGIEVVFHGTIRYLDIFDDAHYTRFKLFVADIDLAKSTAQLAVCNTGNEAN